MPRPKMATIELTPRQREKLRKLTGGDHSEVRFELARARAGTEKALAVKSPPTTLRRFAGFGGTTSGDIPNFTGTTVDDLPG